MIATVFAVSIVLQCALVVGHDLVDVPGWCHGRQVRAALGTQKFWAATLVNAVFPLLAAILAIRYWRTPASPLALNYWVVYCATTVASAIMMWWLPYWRGTNDATKRLYAEMYAGTRQVLPARGDNPRPNLLHLFFHGLFVVNLALAGVLWSNRP